MWTADPNFKRQIEAQDKDMAAACASGNPSDLEKVVGNRLKDLMDKQRAEKERVFKL